MESLATAPKTSRFGPFRFYHNVACGPTLLGYFTGDNDLMKRKCRREIGLASAFSSPLTLASTWRACTRFLIRRIRAAALPSDADYARPPWGSDSSMMETKSQAAPQRLAALVVHRWSAEQMLFRDRHCA